MAYLIGQIWVLIVAAATIGLVLGWLLSEAFRDGRRPPHVDDLVAERDAAVARAETSEVRESELGASVRRLTDDKHSLENQLSMLGARLREAQALAEARAREAEAAGDTTSGDETTVDDTTSGDATDSGPAVASDNRPAGAPPAG